MSRAFNNSKNRSIGLSEYITNKRTDNIVEADSAEESDNSTSFEESELTSESLSKA